MIPSAIFQIGPDKLVGNRKKRLQCPPFAGGHDPFEHPLNLPVELANGDHTKRLRFKTLSSTGCVMNIAWSAAEEMLADLVGPPGQSDTARRVAHDHLVQFTRQVLKSIADISEAVGEQAGVGGTDTAWRIISYLAKHPSQLEPLLKGGIFELPDDWFQNGRLTWQGQDGKIWRPEQALRAVVIKNLAGSAS